MDPQTKLRENGKQRWGMDAEGQPTVWKTRFRKAGGVSFDFFLSLPQREAQQSRELVNCEAAGATRVYTGASDR